MAKRVLEPNIIQSLQSGVQSAGVISHIQSAAITRSTAIPDSVEALIPQNLSLGTKEFCVGLMHNVSCSTLPFNLSSLVPTNVEKYLQPHVSDIESLSGSLMKITPLYIYDSLILGLILMLIMIIVSICSISFILGLKALKVGLLLLLGTICCVLFVIPVIILSVLDSKAKQLPSWIQVEHGEVGKFTMWSLILVTIATITSTFMPIVL
jgi:hypothetical protein